MKRDIIFFDIESTGLDTQYDRIVELCVKKGDEIKTIRVNPTIPIPLEASEIHGIYDKDVKDLPTFKQYAKAVHEFIKDCDIAGYNSNFFDVPMLYAEFERCGINWDYSEVNFIDVGNIFKIHEPRNLTSAYSFYCSKDLENAHSAEADVIATAEVFEAQLKKYNLQDKSRKEIAFISNYENEMVDLNRKFAKNEDGKIIFNFGKYKGEPAEDYPSFLQWMVFKADFPNDTTQIALQILNNL